MEFVGSHRYKSLLQDHHQVLILFIFSVLHTTRTRSANPEPLSLEEGTPAEDNSLHAQAYLVPDRMEEVRQAP